MTKRSCKRLTRRHIADAAQTADGEVEELLSWRDARVDAALARNRSLDDETGWRLNARHAKDPQQLTEIAHHGRDLVAFLVRAGNAAALRGVARRMFRVADDQRPEVAAIALQALLTSPADSDGASAYHVYRTLGPKAGLALLRTGNDEIARGVARAWRWTLDDGIFDALRSHPREYVRRKMVPAARRTSRTDLPTRRSGGSSPR